MRAEHEIRNYSSQNRAEYELGKIMLNTKLGTTVPKIVLSTN